MSTGTTTGGAAAATEGAHAPRNRWATVVWVALATFLSVTAEITPIALLTPIADDLDVAEGVVGLTVTITGLVAAVAGASLPLVVRRLDRRTALVGVVGLLAVAHVLMAVAPTFALLAAARVAVGIGVGGLWALLAETAQHLVEPRRTALATTIVFGGVSTASVLGVPAAAFLGAGVGWRGTCWAIAGVAALVAVVLAALLPPMPVDRPQTLRRLAGLLRVPGVAAGLLVTALVVTAHFGAYTYVRPAFESFAGLGATLIGALLLVEGVAGVVGNFGAGPRAARSPRTAVVLLSLGLVVVLAVAPLVGRSFASAAVVVALWGLCYGVVTVSTSSWMTEAAPGNPEGANALWVGVYNTSIAVGAMAGGRVHDGAGPEAVFGSAALVAALAALVAVRSGRATRGRR